MAKSSTKSKPKRPLPLDEAYLIEDAELTNISYLLLGNFKEEYMIEINLN
jgi:hypothetical protein